MSRNIKSSVLALLDQASWQEIESALIEFGEMAVINHLFSSLCSTNLLRKWNGVRAFGLIVPRLAKNDIEDARIIMRRLLWSLNDESGGIGWGAPEAMAEIMVKDDRLFEEYSHMLVSYVRQDGDEPLQDGNFLEMPFLQCGLLWGIARLLVAKGSVMEGLLTPNDLKQYLVSPDLMVRGMALFALCLTSFVVTEEEISAACEEDCDLSFFWQDELFETTLHDLAGRVARRS